MILIKIPARRHAGGVIASFDLEWTKNYRIKNGNRPFCFSMVTVRDDADPERLSREDVGVFSAYAESPEEIPALLKEANRSFSNAATRAQVLVGHQLSSDLAVLLNSAQETMEGVTQARRDWKGRAEQRRVVDTRYDIDAILKNKSRRLVDVATECGLDVTQPELKESMTKMQRKFWESGDHGIRERLTVLNIRHSLSAAMLYLLWKRRKKPTRRIHVNRILRDVLNDHVAYVRGATFRTLIGRGARK